MQPGKPTGHQIALLVIISWLLMVPASTFLGATMRLEGMWRQVFERCFPALAVAIVFSAVGPIRRASLEALRPRIGRDHHAEVAIVSLVAPIHFFAYAGALAFWFNFAEGPLGFQQRLSDIDSHAHAMAVALEPASLVGLLAAVVIGPVVEEVLFRAFLYRAWAERYGWLGGMMYAASLFALLHPNFFPSFLAAIALTCLYRRTGSLRAPIVVHAVGNLLAYYPLLGRFVFPRDMPDPGDLQRWTWHVAALMATLLVWPIYVWMSRDRQDPGFFEEMPDAPLPR